MAAPTQSGSGGPNDLVSAELDVEVDNGNVALVWSVTPKPGATIETLTASLAVLENGVLQTQFCGAEYPIGTGKVKLNGTLAGIAACFVPTPLAETAAILTGQVDGTDGGMFFFTKPFTL